MVYTVSKFDVWTGELVDRVGGLRSKLASLAAVGVDLAFVVARRQLEKPKTGVVFLGGIKGAKAIRAAAAAGLTKSNQLTALRVEEINKPGSCFKLTSLLADAGIGLRGLSASVFGKKCVYIVAFDSPTDADRAIQVLRAARRS